MPLVVYLKELHDGQSIPALRREVQAWDITTNQNIRSSEKALVEEIKKLNARCDSLQSQITTINKETSQFHSDH